MVEGTGQRVGGGHHGVGTGVGAAGNDPGPAVGGERHSRLGRDHDGHAGIGAQQRRCLRHHSPRRGVGGEWGAVVDYDDLQGGCAQATKLPLDDLSGLDRLAGRVLPAGPGQGVLDLRGESAEEQQHHRPGQEHDPKVAGAPNPEPGQLAAGRLNRDARLLDEPVPAVPRAPAQSG